MRRGALVHNMVAYRVRGIGLQHIAGRADAQNVAGGHVLHQQDDAVLQPALGGAYGTHVWMVLREPHLVAEGGRTAAKGNKAGELQGWIVNKNRQVETVRVGQIFLPGVRFQVVFPQSRLMALQKPLRIVDAQRVALVHGIDERHPAGAGKMRQAVAQAVHNVEDADILVGTVAHLAPLHEVKRASPNLPVPARKVLCARCRPNGKHTICYVLLFL